MSIQLRFGTENVSSTQLEYLKRAKTTSPSVAARYFYYLAEDDDIKSGEENVHPDWVQIFKTSQSSIRRYLPSGVYRALEGCFSEASIVDRAIGDIEPSASKITFLLGAGASKPSPSDIPTVKELLPDLLARARGLDRADLNQLADYCEKAKIDNIEDLLTAAQLSEFCSRNPTVLSLIDFLLFRGDLDSDTEEQQNLRDSRRELSAVAFLQDTLQVLFGLLSSRMLPAKPNLGHQSIATFARKNSESAIVTTNYDCCMDLALGVANKDYTYSIDFANDDSRLMGTKNTTELLKLHGSLNWYYCETCQEVHLIDIRKTVEEYSSDIATYSVIAVCRGCGGQRRGLLVPPLAMKFDVAPPLNSLHEAAQIAFNNADVIVVVGFSFADADLYISRMVTKALQTNNDVKAVVFDPDYAVAQKLRRQLSIRIPDFDKHRVISVTGDCSETLPLFLAGRYAERRDETSSTRPQRKVSPKARRLGTGKGGKKKVARRNDAKGRKKKTSRKKK